MRRHSTARLAAGLSFAAAAALASPAEAKLTDDAVELLRARLGELATSQGTRLLELRIQGARAVVGLELSRDADPNSPPAQVENVFESAVGMLEAADPELQDFTLRVARPGEPLVVPSPGASRTRPSSGASRTRPEGSPPRLNFVLPEPERFPDGLALRGKTIALSPGHGYIYYDNLGTYSTQRGRVSWTDCGGCRGIVEDFETHEIIVRHLVPLLEGAGARVVLLRERDYGEVGSIVEDTDAAFTGTGLTRTPRAQASGGADSQSSAPDAAGTWTLRAPGSGPQWLSTYFAGGPTQAAAAQLELSGPFGTLRYTLDQRTQAARWIPVGLLDLSAGTELTARLSAGAGGLLVLDALRLGSGKHSSGRAWWSMGAEPYAEYQNAPASVRANGDVGIRPAYAEWFGADVYLSFHSNASGQPNSTAAGTSTYRYNCGRIADHTDAPPAAECDDPPGSDRLLRLVHGAMVADLRAGWDPNWRDRGPKVANFGELRVLDGIPGILVESAFHDNVVLAQGSTLKVTDNQALHDPRVRRLFGYAIYRGLSEFLVGGGPKLLPDRVEALAAIRRSATAVEVRFTPLPGATRYRVYVARGGRTFDRGTLTTDPNLTITDLRPEEPIFVRVAALNAAGEGLGSKVVGARPSARRAQALIVDGFDREDAWVQEPDNQRNTALLHGLALASEAHAFDGATEAGWAAGLVRETDYDGVVLALGRESTADGVLTAPLRARVATFAAGGGAVLATGSELGWALDARGDAESKSFLSSVFGVSLADDNAEGNVLSAAPAGWVAQALAGPAQLDEGAAGGIEIRSSDAFTPAVGAVLELSYPGGAAAAVRSGKNLILGVALDSVSTPAARAAIAGAWARNAIPLAVVEPIGDAGLLPDSGPPDTGAPDTGVPEDAGLDAGVAPDAAPAEDAARPRGILYTVPGREQAPIEGGCGCDATGRGPDGVAATLGLVLVLMGRPRRRGPR